MKAPLKLQKRRLLRKIGLNGLRKCSESIRLGTPRLPIEIIESIAMVGIQKSNCGDCRTSSTLLNRYGPLWTDGNESVDDVTYNAAVIGRPGREVEHLAVLILTSHSDDTPSLNFTLHDR
jgi:hypothetical protein